LDDVNIESFLKHFTIPKKIIQLYLFLEFINTKGINEHLKRVDTDYFNNFMDALNGLSQCEQMKLLFKVGKNVDCFVQRCLKRTLQMKSSPAEFRFSCISSTHLEQEDKENKSQKKLWDFDLSTLYTSKEFASKLQSLEINFCRFRYDLDLHSMV